MARDSYHYVRDCATTTLAPYTLLVGWGPCRYQVIARLQYLQPREYRAQKKAAIARGRNRTPTRLTRREDRADLGRLGLRQVPARALRMKRDVALRLPLLVGLPPDPTEANARSLRIEAEIAADLL